MDLEGTVASTSAACSGRGVPACLRRLVVELKRDIIVRGTLESVDAGMGLTLTGVVFENVEVRRSAVACGAAGPLSKS